jgi:myo-inositol-1(or 4)-monophosphatase
VRLELAAAHAAVDEAVEILRAGRTRRHTRIDKATNDFLTEVDLASEATLKRALAASTPQIGFYGEEGGGASLESGLVWVADPLDGTINYATGSPLCGVMLGLLEDGVPVLGVIDLPFLGVRVDSGAVVDVGAFADGIIGMGDAFHRGGARLDAFLELTATVHRLALRFRCVGAASVLWTWLVSGQIQGMVLAHNNPYDVVAGHAIASAAGAIVTDYAGAPLTLSSSGAMAPASSPNSSRSPPTSPRRHLRRATSRGELPKGTSFSGSPRPRQESYAVALMTWAEALIVGPVRAGVGCPDPQCRVP